MVHVYLYKTCLELNKNCLVSSSMSCRRSGRRSSGFEPGTKDHFSTISVLTQLSATVRQTRITRRAVQCATVWLPSTGTRTLPRACRRGGKWSDQGGGEGSAAGDGDGALATKITDNARLSRAKRVLKVLGLTVFVSLTRCHAPLCFGLFVSGEASAKRNASAFDVECVRND